MEIRKVPGIIGVCDEELELSELRIQLKRMNPYGIRGLGSPENRFMLGAEIKRIKKKLVEDGIYERVLN